MAEEMVLIPKLRYERLVSKQTDSATDPSPAPSSERGGDASEGKSKDSSAGQTQENSGEKTLSASQVKTDYNHVNAHKGKSSEKNGGKIANDSDHSDKHFKDEGFKKRTKMAHESILNQLSSTIKDKAERVLNHIHRKGGKYVNWNSRGRLIYENHVVNGSNMVELLEKLLSKRKMKLPTGYKMFHKALVKINVPLSLLKVPAKVDVVTNALKNKWISY
jgi:hypothetical protein